MPGLVRCALAVLLAFGLIQAADPTASRAATPEAAQRSGPQDVFISFKQRPGPAEEALVRALGGTVRHRYSIVEAIAAQLPAQAIPALQNNPNVAAIEPDIEVEAVHINNAEGTEIGNAWGVDRLDAEVVQASYKGSGVRLAIVDSGSGPHPDLNVAERINCIGSCRSGGNDDNGHGTHVAGSAAGRIGGGGTNGGVVGMAPEATLISCKALGASGSGSYSDVVGCLDQLGQWADANAGQLQVANFSLGSSRDPGTTVKKAFDNASAKKILSVAAAGNSGNAAGRGDNTIYPAKYSSVVAVAASDRNDQRASWSSTGAAVELTAPGVNIWSTHLNNGYGYLSGTSMASPHAAGAAALLISKLGVSASISTVREQLQAGVKDLGATGKDNQYGYGLVDPLKLTGLGSLDSHK